ncbi:MAG: cobalamin-dependent protein, partial [Anaerolineae bacterium]
MKGQVLLINPWIYDFAAYDLWIEPLGLLTIAAVLRDNGYGVTVVDCLIPHADAPRRKPDGSGKFFKTLVAKPEPLAHVPRHYGRYGLPLAQFDAALAAAPSPDVVMLTSGMTYWYPGTIEAIRRVRVRFGEAPVVLGGVYATLCPDHARQHSGADQVIVGPGVVAALRFADEVTGHDSQPERYADARAWLPPAHEFPVSGVGTASAEGKPPAHEFPVSGVGAASAEGKPPAHEFPVSGVEAASAEGKSPAHEFPVSGVGTASAEGKPPAHELVPRPFAGLITSWGCPYRCTYCASHRLQPEFVRRDPAAVVGEIAACARRGIRHFAFYDDALLLDAGRHIAPILEGVLARGLDVHFHTPNGIHASEITAELAVLMWRVGFATLRISLETLNTARQRA